MFVQQNNKSLDMHPFTIPGETWNAAFASPNASNSYPRVKGSSYSLTEMNYNLSIAVKEGIPLTQSTYVNINTSQVVTGTRVTFAPPGVAQNGPLQPSPAGINETRALSMCLIIGLQTWNPYPYAGGSAEAETGKCSSDLDECEKEIGSALLSNGSRRENTGCYNFESHRVSKSCKDKLNWGVSLTTRELFVNDTSLNEGGMLMEWASEPHDAGNLTSYREAIRSTFGVYYYFVVQGRNDTTGNFTNRLGALRPGFMCAQASNIAPGSQSGASALGGGLSFAGLVLAVMAVMMAL